MRFGVNSLANLDFIDVPYLEELQSYLPIRAIDKEDVDAYLKSVTDSVVLNYGGEQYQFAYFGLHLLYMTYVYFSVKKTSTIIPERYKDAMILARPYHGEKVDFDNINSAFVYSLMPEKELPKVLKIIGFGDDKISEIGGLVSKRDDMAHATGSLAIKNEQGFFSEAGRLCASARNIHRCMDGQIRNWFKDFLLRYCNNEFEEYDEVSDIITEQMIEGFNLSSQELSVCNAMSLKSLIQEHPEFNQKLLEFKSTLKKYCDGFFDFM